MRGLLSHRISERRPLVVKGDGRFTPASKRATHPKSSTAPELSSTSGSAPLATRGYPIPAPIGSRPPLHGSPDCLRRGCARELTKALRRAYPGVPLSTSPAEPTNSGRLTMLAPHQKGYIDEFAIDLAALDPDHLEEQDDAEQWASITNLAHPCSEV